MAVKMGGFYLIAAWLFLSGCGSGKGVVSTGISHPSDMDELWNELKKSNLEYRWLSAKVDAEVGFDGLVFSGQGDILIRKDSAMLFSVKKFGFEMVRALIRPDSVFVINRLEGSYDAARTDSLLEKYRLPFSYSELEQLLAGNFLTTGYEAYRTEVADGSQTLHTGNNSIRIDYELDPEKKVREIRFKDRQDRSVESELEAYGRLSEWPDVAAIRRYYFPDKENNQYSLSVRVQKIEVDKEKPLKFEIPSSYLQG